MKLKLLLALALFIAPGLAQTKPAPVEAPKKPAKLTAAQKRVIVQQSQKRGLLKPMRETKSARVVTPKAVSVKITTVDLPVLDGDVVLEIVSLGPVYAVAPELFRAPPHATIVVVSQVSTPQAISIGGSVGSTLAREHIIAKDFEKLAVELKAAGLSDTVIQAFIERLK